jgi:hypothetical protein
MGVREDLDALSERHGRQDAALREAWPDNPSPAYRRGREAYIAEARAKSEGNDA